MWKVQSLHMEVEGHPYYQRQGIPRLGQEISINKPCYFFTNLLLKAQTPLSCHFFTNLLFLCLKGVKAACFCHFYGSYIYGTTLNIKLNVFFFPPVNLPCVSLIIRPAKRTKRGKGKFSPPWQHEALQFLIMYYPHHNPLGWIEGFIAETF